MIMGGYSRQLRALHTAARDADRVPSAARAAVLRDVSPCSRLLACVWIACASHTVLGSDEFACCWLVVFL